MKFIRANNESWSNNGIVGSPIAYEIAVVNRKEAPDKISLFGRLGREISYVIIKHKTFFKSIDKKQLEK